MINYIIQVMLFQILFLAVYDLFLHKETFFQKNRLYLIVAPIVSFLLPLIKIPSFQKATTVQEYSIYLPEIILSPQKVIEQTNWYTQINYFELLFFIGLFIFLTIFIIKLIRIVRLILKYKAEHHSTFNLVFLPQKAKAFSFFNYIFLGQEIPKNQQETIIAHEVVHSQQKHSADLLFFEVLKIIMWFNPMLYFYQQRMAIIHEYIADDFATKNSQRESYINNLLSEVFAVENISFINQFYKHSFLKKRIIMMTKEKSKQVKQLKYLVLIPVLASMLFYTACSDSETVEEALVKKEVSTMYMKFGEKEMTESKTKKESYLDSYFGTEIPEWKEISYEDLSDEEKFEYQEYINKKKDMKTSYLEYVEDKIYRGQNGRSIIAHIIDFSKISRKVETERLPSENGSVSFMVIEKTPVFPGCETQNKACFHKMVQQHFKDNFDGKLANTLGLESGRKRVFINMTIATDGNVVDIKTRTPHPEIDAEVKRVMNLLPKMTPGEDKGKKVAVKYSIPFTLMVE